MEAWMEPFDKKGRESLVAHAPTKISTAAPGWYVLHAREGRAKAHLAVLLWHSIHPGGRRSPCCRAICAQKRVWWGLPPTPIGCTLVLVAHGAIDVGDSLVERLRFDPRLRTA